MHVIPKNSMYKLLKKANAFWEKEIFWRCLKQRMVSIQEKIATKRYSHANNKGRVENKNEKSFNILNTYGIIICLQKLFSPH